MGSMAGCWARELGVSPLILQLRQSREPGWEIAILPQAPPASGNSPVEPGTLEPADTKDITPPSSPGSQALTSHSASLCIALHCFTPGPWPAWGGRCYQVGGGGDGNRSMAATASSERCWAIFCCAQDSSRRAWLLRSDTVATSLAP